MMGRCDGFRTTIRPKVVRRLRCVRSWGSLADRPIRNVGLLRAGVERSLLVAKRDHCVGCFGN